MFLARLGSLNALEQTKDRGFWRQWLGTPLPSADSLGRILECTEPETIRQALHELYSQLKRNRALPATSHGLMALAIDGHESHATYRRCCAGCLERRVHTRSGWRTQYYHRWVDALLLSGKFPTWIDSEPIEPGEEEIAAAKRLLTRALANYPRAFDLVLGDALYTEAGIYALLLDHGKDALTVLKANQPELLQEARTLLEEVEPIVVESPGRWKELRDLAGFSMASELKRPLRVVVSRESRTVRRQLDGQKEESLSEWIWVTTCSSHRATTEAIVRLGHARWDIENQGFNEFVNHWYGDHVYKHSAKAMLNFSLLAMLACNLFRAFYTLQLKAKLHRRWTCLHIARTLASELYHSISPAPQARSP
jgi:hypothetical protein